MSKGKIYSETSFYVDNGNGTFTDDFGNKLRLSSEYISKILKSADNFDKEEKVTATQLAETFKSNPRTAMTVAFFKKDKDKTKTAYKKEVSEKVEQVKNAKVSEIEAIVLDLINSPITDKIPGELRIMKGRHHGSTDDFGRVSFIDMEQLKDTSKDNDTRARLVDPRTLQYIIIDNVKYVIK